MALGENGLLSGMRRGRALFDLSTSSPTMVRKINAAFVGRDVYLLDRRSAAGRAGHGTASWRSGSAVTSRSSTVIGACSTPWATRRAMSGRSASDPLRPPL